MIVYDEFFVERAPRAAAGAAGAVRSPRRRAGAALRARASSRIRRALGAAAAPPGDGPSPEFQVHEDRIRATSTAKARASGRKSWPLDAPLRRHCLQPSFSGRLVLLSCRILPFWGSATFQLESRPDVRALLQRVWAFQRGNPGVLQQPVVCGDRKIARAASETVQPQRRR